MILSFTAIDANTQLREFYCQQTELEDALELLNSIASQGDRLLHAHIVDGKSYLELPVDAFDGQAICEPLKQLEQQWQEILDKPVRSTKQDNTWYIELTQKRIQLYEERIEQFTQLINTVEGLRQQVDRQMYNELLRTKLISRYDSLLATCCQYIEQAQIGQQQVLKKLSLVV